MSSRPWLVNYPQGAPHDLGPLEFGHIGQMVSAAARKYGARTAFENFGNGALEFTPGSSLDLYLGEGVRSLGNFSAGNPTHAGSLRIYMGASEDVTLTVGNQAFHGLVYAPKANVHVVGNSRFRGGLFARTLALHRRVSGGEDFTKQEAVQRGLASGVLDQVVFGRNEPAAILFHRALHELGA